MTTTYTVVIIFNTLCEDQSDVLMDSNLNSMGCAARAEE